MQPSCFQKYFTFQGRLNRRSYLLRNLILMALGMLFDTILSAIFDNPFHTEALSSLLGSLLNMLLSLPLLASSLSLSIRRLHDMDKSGWYCFILLLPLFNLLLGFCLIFFRGTTGANPYGEDPLASRPLQMQPPTNS